MKGKHIALIIALIIIADQALKIYIKTNFLLNTHTTVFKDWFHLYFVENPGMAYGMKFGGELGKMLLTLFRLGAVIFGTWYLAKIAGQPKPKGFFICAALIYAGALGNLIDSMFYGLIFDKGMVYNPSIGEYMSYQGLAHFGTPGYASFLKGNVVDMLYFPIIKGHFPSWMPFWGGEDFEFFRPIFNIADAAISVGVITLLLFQKKLLAEPKTSSSNTPVETESVVNDENQVL